MLDKVPSAVFSSSIAGRPRYGPLARVSCLGVKFLEYSLAGIVCGFIGQGIANGMMQIKCAACCAGTDDVLMLQGSTGKALIA